MAGRSLIIVAEDLSIRRKRLRLLAHGRGMLEVELLLRPFADAELPALDQAGLDAFERLLKIEDLDLWEIIVGRRSIPDDLDAGMIDKLRGRLAGRRPGG
jgi:antitoxin CptB